MGLRGLLPGTCFVGRGGWFFGTGFIGVNERIGY